MKNERTVLVTGASGFVGGHACRALGADGWQVRAALRQIDAAPVTGAHAAFPVGDLDASPDWRAALSGADVVVHCAGVAHTRFDDAAEARARFDRVNRLATLGLAAAAREAGVGRFVFVSSIGVYGALPDGVVAEESRDCAPREPYAVSKLAAEDELRALCRDGSMEAVVLRPPMIYGPRCPGNFARLARLVATGLPLPLGAISGRRNLVSVANLADLVGAACAHEGDASGVFNVADDDEVELHDIVRAIAHGLGRPYRMVAVPRALLRGALAPLGRAALIDKLAESIRVDSGRARERFGWRAAVASVDGMRDAAASFRSRAAA